MSGARKKPFKLTAPVIPEHPLQRQLVDVLTLEIGPPGRLSPFGVVWWSVDHANYAGAGFGYQRKRRGVVAGIPDTFITHLGKAFKVEIKAENGVMSEGQQLLCAALLVSGVPVAVIDTADQFLAVLDCWEIPRFNRVRRAA